MGSFLRPRRLFLLFFCLAFLLRLPQLLGGNLLPDGDESIVGLMAKHVLEGRSFDLFFYGQRYGLTIVESAVAALFFKLFGISTLPLKLAMLLIWILGAWCFIATALQLRGERASLIVALLLLTMPAWAAWSMKARGGYLTAFLATGLALYLIARVFRSKNQESSWSVFALIGAALGITLLAQPFWLVASLPFLGLLATAAKSRRYLLFSLLSFLVVVVLLLLPGLAERSGYWAPGIFTDPAPLSALRALSFRLLIAFSGAYYYLLPVYVGPFSLIAGAGGVILTLTFVTFALFHLLKHREYADHTSCAVGVLLSLGLTLLMNNPNFSFRYLLAVPTLVALGLGLAGGYLDRLRPFLRLATIALASIIGLCSILAYNEFSALSAYGHAAEGAAREDENEVAAMNRLVGYLQAIKVKHVYCLHPTFQWNIIFASQETILARWLHPRDRLPEYPRAVDQALRSGQPTALVGFYDDAPRILSHLAVGDPLRQRLVLISKRYLVLRSPPAALLHALGFHFLRPPPHASATD